MIDIANVSFKPDFSLQTWNGGSPPNSPYFSTKIIYVIIIYLKSYSYTLVVKIISDKSET